MSTILYECDVTEFDIIPNKENHLNAFALNKKSVIISMMNTDTEKILAQTEISREDAVELAQLILLKYN